MNKSRKRIAFVTYAGVLPFYLSPVIGYYDIDKILVRFTEIKNIEVPHVLSRIASFLGLVVIITFVLGITMAVITVVKLLG